MQKLTSKTIEMTISECGSIVMRDKARGVEWLQDSNAMFYETKEGDAYKKVNLTFTNAKAKDGKLYVNYIGNGIPLTYVYAIYDDFAEITLLSEGADKNLARVAMPSFEPSCGNKKYLLPIKQGMLWDTRGEPFERYYHEAGHTGFSMPMFALLSDNGGYVYISETQDDCNWNTGKDTLKTWCCNIQLPSLGTLRYDRVGRVYFTDPTITKAAKCYRARVKEKGRFISFKEKIEKRPSLKKLFGAIMCYVGYCQDDIDYVANFKRLKEYGFDKALIYPVRFNAYSNKFLMGGQPPIFLTDEQIALVKALGYDICPWTWINESIDDGTVDVQGMSRRNAEGNLTLGWQIDEYKYYHICTTFMEKFYKEQRTQGMKEMTWDHFDVITAVTNNECYALDHEAHMGRPMSKTEDREYIRSLLKAAGEFGPVSSESFNDAYSLEYDMGSVKAWPVYDVHMFMPIPLTMLVYHDSIMHTWWEVHNYNSKYFSRDVDPFYQYGGGTYDQMATMDALYGCPPDVFPFGAQYAWTGNGSETMLYRYRFDDPEVQLALKKALPVAKLHEHVGMMEMIDFEFLSDDYQVQCTTFEDGTKVYANFGLNVRHHDDCGSLASCEWKRV